MSNFLEDVQRRLSDELKRVGAVEIARATGISRQTIYNWIEKGNASLDKMGRLEEAGVDTAYVLTGQRSQTVADTPGLNRREQALLDNYRHSNDAGKKAVETTASAFAKQDRSGTSNA